MINLVFQVYDIINKRIFNKDTLKAIPAGVGSTLGVYFISIMIQSFVEHEYFKTNPFEFIAFLFVLTLFFLITIGCIGLTMYYFFKKIELHTNKDYLIHKDNHKIDKHDRNMLFTHIDNV